MAYAHSRNRLGQRQELAAHLRAVAGLAATHAGKLGAADLGRALGLWHDVGKFAPAFQQYLLAAEAGHAPRGGPDHKAAGAQLAAERLGPLAMLIHGHHGGLCSPAELKAWLAEQRADAIQTALQLAHEALPDLEPATLPELPAQARSDPLAAEMLLRLLFSTLVDADYLDTERHFTPEAAAERRSPASIRSLWTALQRDQARLSGRGADALSQARHAIYRCCLDASERPAGLFRLTVPTGGGKTRSAMAFALRHALRHGQERVIVAIPYISITEQTADVYRAIFEPTPASPRAVLEHHSAAIADDADEGEDGWARLAAENWDAPIVVTTTVQLFESLFARSTSRARKVHRLANSIIILDEAQLLPPHLLEPILDALRQLATHYHTTIVLSTATQPAFEAIPAFRDLPATEIVPHPERFFRQLERVGYQWRLQPGLEWPEVAAAMARERQALAVVNTKADALALLDALDDPQALHLSTLLCGAHRRRVIAEVKRRLAAGEECRLVSTQVVEAGVDLDFALVLRALAPLDSVIQAAGRCNREGRLPQGQVVVFDPAQGHLPPGAYRAGTAITRALLARGDLDPSSPAAAAAYFQQLFQTVGPDRQRIQRLRRALDFRQVAREFRMIADDTESVVVPYGTPQEQAMVACLRQRIRRQAGRPRDLLRALQPYLVTVRAHEARRYRSQGLIAPLAPGLGEWLGTYDPIRGLTGRDIDSEALIV